jgi:hypothetical protein
VEDKNISTIHISDKTNSSKICICRLITVSDQGADWLTFLIDILLTLSTAKIWHTVSIKAGIIHVFGITLIKKEEKNP